MSAPAHGPKGLTWQQMPPGETRCTMARTVTETDLVTFVNWFGFTERLFLEADYAVTEGYRGRLVPGALTLCIAEGLTLQTGMLYGTGVAFLGADIAVRAPVYVGDTLHVVITVGTARAASKDQRGVVTTSNAVINQRGETVLEYAPVRLVRGDRASA